VSIFDSKGTAWMVSMCIYTLPHGQDIDNDVPRVHLSMVVHQHNIQKCIVGFWSGNKSIIVVSFWAFWDIIDGFDVIAIDSTCTTSLQFCPTMLVYQSCDSSKINSLTEKPCHGVNFWFEQNCLDGFHVFIVITTRSRHWQWCSTSSSEHGCPSAQLPEVYSWLLK
jgi:hypothetical protein